LAESDKKAKKPKREQPETPDAHTAEVAFDEIMDAILGADPGAVHEHLHKRRNQKSKPLKK
jgi:DNA polymerase III delta subunit